eukprot:PITA_28844
MTGNNERYIASIKKELGKGFEMTDLGYVLYCLGIEVTQHPKSIFLSQKNYIGNLLNRFMQKPYEGHWSAAKRVLRICYESWIKSCLLEITQTSIPADSTTEVEYVAAAEATKEIVWLRKTLENLQVKQVQSTPLMINNTSAIKLDKNPKFHDRTKHINTKYHLIQDHVEAKAIHLHHYSKNKQIADIFTKALGREKFERFRTMLGLTNIPSD